MAMIITVKRLCLQYAGDNMSTKQRDGRVKKGTILTAVLGTN